MKKVLLTIVLLAVVAVAAVLAIAATKPADYNIVRSATIAAPPEVLFAQVNDFHQWPHWSPWEKLDPAMKRTLEGDSGMGATYAWAGNSDAGEGKMTITRSEPSSAIDIQLDFIKPFASTAQCDFAFAPGADGTTVTWTMKGKYDFVSKVFCVFVDMDKMIGADFETGLASLKTIAESAPPAEGAAADSTSAS